MEATPAFNPKIVQEVDETEFCLSVHFFSFSYDSTDDCKNELNKFLEKYWDHLAADSFDEICNNCQKLLNMLHDLNPKVLILTFNE
jgi:hypothetical protein